MTASYLPRAAVAVRHRFTPLSVFPRPQQVPAIHEETDLDPLMDPYEWLAEHPDVRMALAPLPDDELGRWYPDARVILISDQLTQAERRCTLVHELVHRMRDDIHMDDDLISNRVERSCHRMAAKMLISLHDLADALMESEQPDEVAERLWVDVETLQARLESLHPSERGYLRRRLAMKEQTA